MLKRKSGAVAELRQKSELYARANSGFSRDDETAWAEWIAEDRHALKCETPIGLDSWEDA